MTDKVKLVKAAPPKLVNPLGEELASKKDKTKKNKPAVTQLPKPVGWRILIAMPEVEEKTVGGIIKASSTLDTEQVSTVIGYVLDMGDECFQDKDRFKGVWCKKGDFVLIGAYKGVRFKIHGKEFRIINDDTVQAIVDDPRGYSRV